VVLLETTFVRSSRPIWSSAQHPYRSLLNDLSQRNFGYLIAYVLPGFVVLWGLRPLSQSTRAISFRAAAVGTGCDDLSQRRFAQARLNLS
jgi:hypothetical protein